MGRSPISTADFTLRRVTFYNNGFRPYAYVRLDESTGTGTVVRVTLSASNWVRYFLIFYHGFIAIVSAIAVLSTLASHPSPHDEIPFLTFGILLVWPVALTLFGRAIATGDRRFLIRFLVEELEATEVQTVSGLVVG